MAQCTDKRIGDMLFAYELDLLDADDEQLVELHLVDCEYCLDRAKRLANAVDTIRDDSEAREVILREDLEATQAPQAGAEKRRWPAFVRIVALAVAAMVVLLLRPWQIEFHPSHEAVAAGNRIAIMSFRNLAESVDKLQWGQVMSSLLTTDLSQSRRLQVVSTQHLLDLARNDQDPSAPPDEKRARELAGKAGARWIVEGDILQLEPTPIVVARVVDSRDGTVKSSEKIVAEPNQSLYALVDPLSTHIVASILQPSPLPGDLDRPIAEMTTSSPHALQFYLEGLALQAQFYYTEAAERFAKAIATDSTFAIAYYRLSRLRAGSDRSRLLDKAKRYSGGAGRRDSLLIASGVALAENDAQKGEDILLQIAREFPQEKEPYYDLGCYYLPLGRFEDAARCLHEAIKIDSGYKSAYNELAYYYARVGDSSNAMWAIDRYVAIAPKDANVYDSRGDIQLQFGMLDRAMVSYRQALAIKPDFYSSLRKLGDCLLYERQFDRAESCYIALRVAPVQDNYTEESIWLLAIPALRQGDFQKAVEVLETNARSSNAVNPSLYYLHFLRAQLLAELDRKAAAKAAVNSAVAIAEALQFDIPHAYVDRIYLLARVGDIAKAERELANLSKIKGDIDVEQLLLPLAQGYIEYAKGNYRTSRQLLGSVLAATQNPSGRFYFPARSIYARSCLQAGDIVGAFDTFESLANKPAAKRVFWSLLDISNFYYLGLTYEKRGEYEAAATWYNEYIISFSKASHPSAEVLDAKKRLQRLSQKSHAN